MRRCKNPDCRASLEGRRAGTESCNGACRAAASKIERGERLPAAKVTSFWKGYAALRRPAALGAHS